MSAYYSTAELSTAECSSDVSLSCDSASFAVSGQDVVITSLPADKAAYTLAGETAVFAATNVADAGSFALSGQALTGIVTGTFAQATFNLFGYSLEWIFTLPFPSVEGSTAEFSTAEFPALGQFSLQANAATFALTGEDIGQPLLADYAAFVLSGEAAEESMPVGAGSFALAGQTLAYTAFITVDAASYALAGQSLAYTAAITAQGASYTLTGEAALGTASITAGQGSFTLTGEAITLATDALFGYAAFTLTGEDAAFQPVQTAGTGSFALSGQSLTLATTMVMGQASFTLTGEPAQEAMPVGTGSFLLTLQDVIAHSAIVADRALFALTSPAVGLHEVFNFPVDPGSFTLTGEDILTAVLSPEAAHFTLIGWRIADAVGPSGDHIFLIEVQAHNGTTVETFYLGTEGFTSAPSDTPANQSYVPRVIDPGNFERHLFSQGTIRGKSSVGYGDVTIASGDPGNGDLIDDWLTYGFDGRPIVIKALPFGAKSRTEALTLFTGTMDRITSTKPLDSFALKLGDRLADLEKPLLTTLFAGTTTSTGATAEGNADLAGKIKQRCFGQCTNVLLQPANVYDLIYLASDGGFDTCSAVYDGGVALTADGDSANISALQSATIAAGHYRTCKAAGLIRLGGPPTLSLTADITVGATSADRTAAQIAKSMLDLFGMTTSDYVDGSFSQLDGKNAAEVCYFIDDDRTCLTAIQDVLDSIGGWIVPSSDGSYVVGRFEAPSAGPALTFELDTYAITDSIDRIDAPIPSWRVNLTYGPIFHVQPDSDLAGSVDATRRATLASEFRSTTASDSSVKTKHLSSPETSVTTYLISKSDADTEAARILDLVKAEREMYTAVFPLSDAWAAEPGTALTLKHPRLGLSSGKPFNVLGRIDQYATENISFTLWG